MTQDIKAAIAGAIDALEYANSHIHMGQSTFFSDRLAALRRIEFVEDVSNISPLWTKKNPNHRWIEGWDRGVQYIAENYAIVKMEPLK